MKTFLAIALSLIAGEAMAAATPYSPPETRQSPSQQELLAADPPALRNQYSAASFACDVSVAGAVDHCELLNELPAGMGVAEAARALLPKYSFAPARVNGSPVVDTTVVTVSLGPAPLTNAVKDPRLTSAFVRAAAPPGAAAAGERAIVQLSCISSDQGVVQSCRGVTSKGQDPQWAEAAVKLLSSAPNGKAGRIRGRAVQSLAEFEVNWATGGNDTNPDWRKRPTYEDLVAVWPRAAMSRGIGGEAMLACKVSLEGALFDCVVENEKPAGMGFGAAALALTPQLLMNPATRDGKPVVATIRMPVAFMSGSGAPGRISGGIQPGRRVFTNVAWTAAPSYAQAAAAFPVKARQLSTPGHVALNCVIGAGGALRSCGEISEEPKRFGFGRAARDLAASFRAPTTAADGSSTQGASVHLPITFAIAMLETAPRIGKPQWITLPTAEDVRATLPPSSRTAAGRVVLDCRVGLGGHLEDCQISEETPTGQGLGASALNVAQKFVLSIWTDEGLPTQGGRVLVPIRYAIE